MKKRFVLAQVAGLAVIGGLAIFSYNANHIDLSNEKDKAIDTKQSVAFSTDQGITRDIRKKLIKASVAHDRVKQAEKQKQAVQAASVKTDNIKAKQETSKKSTVLTDRSSRPKGKTITAKLTAYTACDAGMDCRGITYTETKVKEGRTIAVDKNVIPLGSWVYIEGVGYRKAEDIGGAIKGNKIDVYFTNKKDAIEFGVKRNVKVILLDEPPKGV